MTNVEVFNFDFITHGFRRDQENAAQKRDREILEVIHGDGFKGGVLTQPPVSNKGGCDLTHIPLMGLSNIDGKLNVKSDLT